MGKIELIKKAIEDAENGISKLTPDVMSIGSYTSNKIRYLLNNLGGISSMYFEIGLHKCGTFISSLYGNNNIKHGIGCDNWSQFEQNGLTEKEAYANCNKYLKEGTWMILERDCFKLNPRKLNNVDFYNYDGNHSLEDQEKAITFFYPSFANEFILCVDDYQWPHVKNGTQNGIKNSGLEALFERELGMNTPSDVNEYWNGFYIALLKKSV